MKISDTTTSILKNFASINPGIQIKAGNVIKTISTGTDILAKAVVTDDFPKDFCIYELQRFIGLVSTFSSPVFSFEDTRVIIKEESSNIQCSYAYADSNTIVTAPDKELELTDTIFEFTLTEEMCKRIMNAAAQLQLSEIVIRCDGSNVALVATDVENKSSNEFSIDIGEHDTAFRSDIKTEKFKLLPKEYHVKLTPSFAHFHNEAVEYWIALEETSEI